MLTYEWDSTKAASDETMKPSDPDDIPMRDEYDFSEGVHGTHAERRSENTNIVRLDPDVAELYPDSKAVNDALRKLAAQASG